MPRLSRFAWLMGLYAENYERLDFIFRPGQLAQGAYVSRVPGALDLDLEVLTRHPYTLELRLSYRMRDPQTGQPDPSAYVRLYRDARQAEVTHCYVGRHWQDVLGLKPSVQAVLNHRLRMNSFLSKWLEYLAGQQHGPSSLQPAAPAAPGEQNAACA